MRNKIFGILVVMLLITISFLPVTGKNTLFSDEDDFRGYEKSESGITKLEWMIAGDALRSIRSYWIHTPSGYEGSESVPLLLVFHGITSIMNNPFGIIKWYYNAPWMETYSEFSIKADEEGFIVVYPNSLLVLDPTIKEFMFAFDCPNYPNDWTLGKNLIDDVGFIRELIEKIQQDYNIDSNRIYVAGFSGGAAISYYFGSQYSDIIAAIGSVAGSIAWKNDDESPEEFRYIPVPNKPVSVISFHGTNDNYNGTSYKIGALESIEFWVEHNACNPEPKIEEFGNIIMREYTEGNSNTEVVFYTITDGEHVWPGALDDNIQEISATDLMWDFFETHPKQ